MSSASGILGDAYCHQGSGDNRYYEAGPVVVDNIGYCETPGDHGLNNNCLHRGLENRQLQGQESFQSMLDSHFEIEPFQEQCNPSRDILTCVNLIDKPVSGFTSKDLTSTSGLEPHDIKYGVAFTNETSNTATNGFNECLVVTDVSRKKTTKMERRSDGPAQKQSQITATLKWLMENYERADGVCLPRCVLYTHYLDFCKRNKYSPAGAATFGKIIRQRFPKLTTRRLGTRGQSKYHYYGIGIKETSIYYHSVYTGKGLTRFSGTKVKTEGSSRKYSLSSKTGTLIPEFPDADNLVLPPGVEREKVRIFLMMYRTHCQRILDTVISTNFEEVQNFLLHFWQGMPEHLVSLLSEDAICDVIGLCDSILYKVLIDVLVPSTIQDIPESLSGEMKLFIKRFPVWMGCALEGVPENIQKLKSQVVSTMVGCIRRQISFIQLAQTARTVLTCSDTAGQMLKDLDTVDLARICQQSGFADPKLKQRSWKLIKEGFDELKSLVAKQSSVEAFTEWADNLVDTCVLQKSSAEEVQAKAAEFLLQWTVFGSLVMRDLTLCSAATFGSLHLLHLTLTEYVLLVMETQGQNTKEATLQKAVGRHLRNNSENICVQAKVRATTKSSPPSPKHKKRRHEEIEEDKSEVNLKKHFDKNKKEPTHFQSEHCGLKTAFSRIEPSVKDLSTYGYPANSVHSYLPQVTSSLPVVKHPMNHSGTPPEKAYYPQLGLTNSYTEYPNLGGSVHGARVPNRHDGHIHSFIPTPLTGNSFGPSYWNDSRGHVTYDDVYPGYSYCKVAGNYDSYGRSSALLRGGFGQDGFVRSPFDPARNYYGLNHDGYGGTIPSYMELNHGAPPHGQYSQQDALIQPEDVYSSNFTGSFGHPFKKSLISPFR